MAALKEIVLSLCLLCLVCDIASADWSHTRQNRVKDVDYRKEDRQNDRIQKAQANRNEPEVDPLDQIIAKQQAKKAQEAAAQPQKTTPKFTGVFQPIDMKFPETVRSGSAAEEYKVSKLASLKSGARKEDPNLIMTGESCARGLGSLYDVFSDEKEKLYSVCFNDDRASAIYSTHTIDLAGKSLEHSQHGKFKGKYTMFGWGVDDLYTAGEQTKRFDAKFGSDEKITDADTKKCNYFSRNHLTPHADFASPATQALTYYFQNCFPGKQSMNAQNWSKLEDFVRMISIEMQKKLRIFTGVYGVLQKKDKSGKMTDIYLDTDNNRIEVPLIVWKLVIDPKTNDSVAFFTSNDTDMDEKEIQLFSSMCNSVCDQLGYNFNTEAKAGYTLCCPYEDFAKYIKFVPVQLKDSKLLKNNKHIEDKAARDAKRSKSGWGSRSSSPERDSKSA